VLEQLEHVFDETCGHVLVKRAVVERARQRAQGLLDTSGGASRSLGVALLTYATELIVAHATELAVSQPELRALVEQIDAANLVPRSVLARDVLRSPELLQLPAAVALEVQLGLIAAFTDAPAVSLWVPQAGSEIRLLAHTGDLSAARGETRQIGRAHV